MSIKSKQWLYIGEEKSIAQVGVAYSLALRVMSSAAAGKGIRWLRVITEIVMCGR
jgi:hypothetical protein